MHKKTLNLIAVCAVTLVIVFALTQKANKASAGVGDNITVDENGKIQTKADQYKADILATVGEENVKNFQKFSKSFQKNSGDNMTDGLSKDVFSQYIKFSSAGSIDEKGIADASADIMKTKTDIANPTQRKDIKIGASNVTTLKTYGNNLAIIQNGVNSGILATRTKPNQTPYLASIYSTTARLILGIEVPESIADSHVGMINGFRKYSEGMNMVNLQNEDPAKALIGLTMVKDATNEIVTNFDIIKKTIILNKVDYAPDEPGYVWISN